MKKLLFATVAIAALGVGGWFAAKTYAKNKIEAAVAQAAADVAAQGGELRYGAISIGGSPLSPSGSITDLVIRREATVKNPATGTSETIVTELRAPSVALSFAVQNPNTIHAALPELMTVDIDAQGEKQRYNIRSQDLVSDIDLVPGRNAGAASARRIEVSRDGAEGAPLVVLDDLTTTYDGSAQFDLNDPRTYDATGAFKVAKMAVQMTLDLPSDLNDPEAGSVSQSIAMTWSGVEGSQELTPKGGALKIAAAKGEQTQSMRDPSLGYVIESTSSYEAPVMSVNFQAQNGLAELSLDDLNRIEGGLTANTGAVSGKMTFTSLEEGGLPGFSMTSAATSSVGEATLRDGALSYVASLDGLALASADAPIVGDLSLSMRKMAMKFAFPFTASETPRPAAFMLDFDGIEGSEGVWALIDMKNALPHEFNRAHVDISADLLIKHDLAKLIAAEAEGEDVNALYPDPVTPTAVTLTDLTLDGLGAALNANGAFEIEGETPKGSGKITMTNWEGLLQNLVAAGLLDEQSAMMGQMMVGAMAVPGDAPGVSVLEVAFRDGMTLVNGQPVGPSPSLPPM